MKHGPEVIGIIPARYGSTRFPGKPLALLEGKPMIQWVYEACDSIFEKVIVATDDQRIENVVKVFGGEVMVTLGAHTSGTSRCAEVLDRLEHQEAASPSIVVNVQGDEPLVKKKQIDTLISLIDNKNADIATLAAKAGVEEGLQNPNQVKVVMNLQGHAMYFSRSEIPHRRNKNSTQNMLVHLGLYAYRADVLREIVKLPPTPLETAESLEQLRWLEHGYSIAVGMTSKKNIGIDTPEDLGRLEKFLRTGR